MHTEKKYDVAVLGAGIVGIASAYYLAKAGKKVAIIDRLQPMSFTSAQSGENFRNWWPHPIMTAFMDHTIDLLEELHDTFNQEFDIHKSGYLLATRAEDTADLTDGLYEGYGGAADKLISHHQTNNSSYVPWHLSKKNEGENHVDIIKSKDLIRQHYPQFDEAVTTLIHIRRAGDIGSHSLAQCMLRFIREQGGTVHCGDITDIQFSDHFTVKLTMQPQNIVADIVVNAAGPFAGEIAGMLGEALPLKNYLQQKIAFKDRGLAIPRHMPFTVDLDSCHLPWTEEERSILQGDDETRWLTEQFPGAMHVRPEGGEHGAWVKMGWAYNQKAVEPMKRPEFDPNFPDILLRGASRLNPALAQYIENLPRGYSQYGGYYTMTEENWPLIGPMEHERVFMAVGMSGFGTMASAVSGSLVTDWILGNDLPSYASAMSSQRYSDDALMADLAKLSRGVL